MKILFVHQNFPGQYQHLARHLGVDPRNRVIFITQRDQGQLTGVEKCIYKPLRQAKEDTHHYLRDLESCVLNAQAVAQTALKLKRSGFVPDLIVGHNGWGEIWYLKDIYPSTPLLGYFEFFYRISGADVGFDPDYPVSMDTGPRLRTRNAGNLLGLEAADFGQCPTHWQRSRYPQRHHSMLEVIHEGIDTSVAIPNVSARFLLLDAGIELCAGDEVLTYVARNLEPYRGFPSFMRALPAVLARRPKVQVLIVGGDGTSYGAALPDGQTFRQQLIAELGDGLDLRRVHFLGRVPYSTYMNLLQVSSAHVYLTYPFVLSWSMLEAMSAGCLVIGSRTAPVEEVIRDGENGFLVDFFSPAQIAEKVIAVLEASPGCEAMRASARQTIMDRYDLKSICLPAHLRLLDRMLTHA